VRSIELAKRHPQPPEIARDRGAQKAALLQLAHVLRDEAVRVVGVGGAGGEARSQIRDDSVERRARRIQHRCRCSFL
jgi:hypothetical protein